VLPEKRGLQPGDRVRIVGGPLTGLTGLHDGLRGQDRVLVLLEMLGRVELRLAQVAAEIS